MVVGSTSTLANTYVLTKIMWPPIHHQNGFFGNSSTWASDACDVQSSFSLYMKICTYIFYMYVYIYIYAYMDVLKQMHIYVHT